MTIYSLSEYELDAGIKLCFEKAERLADDADLIIRNNGNPSHALVLYEFAVEEYGKGELLKECKSKCKSKHNTTGDRCDVDESIFKDHKQKLEQALECLPDDCMKIDIGIRVTGDHYTTGSIEGNRKRRSIGTKRLGGNAVISIGPYMTGLFTTSGLHIKKDKVNLEKHIRWPAVFVDWDDEHKTWMHEIIPYVEGLSNAISSFKKHLINARIEVTT